MPFHRRSMPTGPLRWRRVEYVAPSDCRRHCSRSAALATRPVRPHIAQSAGTTTRCGARTSSRRHCLLLKRLSNSDGGARLNGSRRCATRNENLVLVTRPHSSAAHVRGREGAERGERGPRAATEPGFGAEPRLVLRAGSPCGREYLRRAWCARRERRGPALGSRSGRRRRQGTRTGSEHIDRPSHVERRPPRDWFPLPKPPPQRPGCRIALGATRRQILRLLFGRAIAMIAVGLAAGFVGAALATRPLASLLFAVKPIDPATYVGVAALLAPTSFVALYLPASRATRVYTLVALRQE